HGPKAQGFFSSFFSSFLSVAFVSFAEARALPSLYETLHAEQVPSDTIATAQPSHLVEAADVSVARAFTAASNWLLSLKHSFPTMPALQVSHQPLDAMAFLQPSHLIDAGPLASPRASV